MTEWTAPTQDRVDGYLVTATPIRLVGSTGAPANPLAIF